jgi:hypothetical protein
MSIFELVSFLLGKTPLNPLSFLRTRALASPYMDTAYRQNHDHILSAFIATSGMLDGMSPGSSGHFIRCRRISKKPAA